MKSDPTDTCLNCCLLPSTHMIWCTTCCERELRVHSCCSGRNVSSIHHSSAIPRRRDLFTAGTDLQIWGYRDRSGDESPAVRKEGNGIGASRALLHRLGGALPD